MTDDENVTEPARWVKLLNCATTFEAEQLRAGLEAEGIPVLVRGLQQGIFGPGFQGAVPGGVDVCVPSPELDRAREFMGLEPE